MLYDKRWDAKVETKPASKLELDLIAARSMIERQELWWNGKCTSGGNHCALSAIVTAANAYGSEAERAFKRANGIDHIPGFNDTHTHAEVLAAFDRAISAAASA